MPTHSDRLCAGFGLGLRSTYYEEIQATRPAVDWFEIITENYLVPGGKALFHLDQIRALYPIAMHGVSLSIGGTDPLDRHYLRQVAQLADRIDPLWISDHLCWTGVGGHNTHDLLPLPFTEEVIAHVVARVQQVQDQLGRQILLENVSSYVAFAASEMPEWEFLAQIAERADCLILCDVNNIYVSSRNHGFDPQCYLQGLPTERVGQFHVAGHQDDGELIIDTHDQPVCDPVWSLYAAAVQRFGPVATLLERDDQFPPLSDLLAELTIARRMARLC